MSYLNLLGGFIVFGMIMGSITDVEEACAQFFDMSHVRNSFMDPMLALILVIDCMVIVTSTFSSQVCIERCCMDDNNSCSMADCGRGIWWIILWLAFFASYITVVMALGLLVVCTLAPVVVGLAYAICDPLLQAAQDAQDSLDMIDLNDLADLFTLARTAGIDYIPEDFAVDIDIPDEEMKEVCEAIEVTTNSALTLFVSALLLVLIQVNISIIARGNLVATSTMQRIQDDGDESAPADDSAAGDNKPQTEMGPRI